MEIIKNGKHKALLVSIIMMAIILCFNCRVQAVQAGNYIYNSIDNNIKVARSEDAAAIPAKFGIITEVSSQMVTTDETTVRLIKIMQNDGAEYNYPICDDTCIVVGGVSTPIEDMGGRIDSMDYSIIMSRTNMNSTAIAAGDEKMVAVTIMANGLVDRIEVINQADQSYDAANIDIDNKQVNIGGNWVNAAKVVVFNLNNGMGGAATATYELVNTMVVSWNEFQNAVGNYAAWYINSNNELEYVVINAAIDTVSDNSDECFIATAAFGSKHDWPVGILRDFRDHYLLTNSLGIAFVKFYYHNSPPLAAFIDSSLPLKLLVRIVLAPVIALVYLIYHPPLMVTVLVIMFLFYRYRLRRRYVQA